MRKKDDEIAELQKAVSDMQVFLYQEREQVLKLYAENDRLKIQELQDRKKINRLLSLAGVSENEVTYFVKEPPSKVIISQKFNTNATQAQIINEKKQGGKVLNHDNKVISSKSAPLMTEKYPRDYESLLVQINALETQLQEQTKLSKEQIDALQEDRRIRMEEYETQRQKDAEQIKNLREKLLETQNLLHESTKDYLEAKFEMRNIERKWMAEKDRLLQELDKSCKHEHVKEDQVLFVAQEPTISEEDRKRFQEEIDSLEDQIKQVHQLAEMYRCQVIKLEDELCKIREQGDMTRDLFKDKQDKANKKLQVMQDRYKELERRRNMEIEGFKNDIKILRQKLKSVEKQLFKVTIGYTGCDEIDVLQNVHETTVRSREMQGELNHLKAKIYSLENDIRHL